MAVIKGIAVVWGIPKHFNGIPEQPEGATIRYRFRSNEAGKVYIRHNGTTSCYILRYKDNDMRSEEPWGMLPVGKNLSVTDSAHPMAPT